MMPDPCGILDSVQTITAQERKRPPFFRTHILTFSGISTVRTTRRKESDEETEEEREVQKVS